MAYATTEQLESRWRYMTPEEQVVAGSLLEDAAVILDQMGFGDADEELLRIVSINMVKRAMKTDGDAFGIDGQTTPSMGWASSLPAGELYPYDREITMLRGGARAGSIPMACLYG